MPFMKVSLFRCRKRARAVLRQSGIAPVIAALVFLSFFAFLGLCNLCERLVLAVPTLPRGIAYVIAVAASVLICVLLLAPLSLGTDAFILECLRHGRADYSIFLSFYTARKRYLAAIARMLSRFLRFFGFLLLLWAVLALGEAVASSLYSGGDAVRATLVLCITVLFFALTLLFWISSAARLFLTDAILASSPLLTHRQARALSALLTRAYRAKIVCHALSFLPLFLLSFLLLGIPLMCVIPYERASRNEMALQLLKS